MSSLAACIKKAGKALGREDSKAIREIYDDLVAAGETDPAQRAIDEYLDLISLERADLSDRIADAGGVVPTSDVRYAKGNPTLDIARAIASTSSRDDGDQIT